MICNDIFTTTKVFRHKDRLFQLQQGMQSAPVSLYLIISDLCNLDCVFCAYRRGAYTTKKLFSENSVKNPKRFIALSKIKEIVDDCLSIGVKAIELAGGGEPTTHPYFNEAITYILDKGIDVGLVTNGILLDQTNLDLLLKCKWIRVSIDTASAKTYIKIKKSSETNFDRVLSNLSDLVLFRKNKNFSTTLGTSFVVCRENWNDVYDAIREFKKLGVDYIRFTIDFNSGFIEYWQKIKNNVFLMIESGINDFEDDSFKVINQLSAKSEELISSKLFYKSCPMMNLRSYIGADLNVYTCCINAYTKKGKIGSIKSMSFKEFWLSEYKQNFFNKFDARKCGVCSYQTKNQLIRNFLSLEKPMPVLLQSTEHDNFV